MYRIFIADDNNLTVQALTQTVPWNKWGYELVGSAENGMKAKEGIIDTHPDVAILDISMPEMTGLEVADYFARKREDILFIFLTAYDEFSFAQTAVKIGAFDYILKPLENDELHKVLQRAKDALDKKRKTIINNFEKDDNRNHVRHLLQDSINGVSQAQGLMETLQKQWKAADYELMLVDTVDTVQEINVSEIDMLTNTIANKLSELEKGLGFRYEASRMKEGLLILIGYKDVLMSCEYDLQTLKIASQIVNVGEEKSFSIFVGISNFGKRGIDKLNEVYDEVIFAAQSRFFLENKSIVHYKSITSKSCTNEYMLSRKMQEMFRVLYSDSKAFENYLEDFINLIYEGNYHDSECVKNIFTQIAFAISCCLRQNSTGDVRVKSMETIIGDMHQMDSIQSVFSYIREYTKILTSQTQNEKAAISAHGEGALNYLNEHYMDNITLQDVAEAVGLSESYLCRTLKKETGDSFVNILNKIRICHAQELLQKGELKVYEVAENVGFSNYAYFYQVFKKITGYSPKECR